MEEDGDSLDEYALDLGAFRTECEDDRIDVFLVNEASRFVCAIENKVHAAQRPGQLASYRERLETRFKSYERKLIFLTLRDEQPEDLAWIGCRYGKTLNAMLDRGTIELTEGGVLRVLFEQYAEWIRADGNPNATNFFQAMHLARHELRHSDFVAWLLNPGGTHRLGDAFAKYFMGRIAAVQQTALPHGPERMDWSDLEVRREFANIDVLLLSERHRVAVIVENKVRAMERERQLGDYRAFVHRHFAHDHLVPVFLDMRGRVSSEITAVNLSYRDLLPFFEGWIASAPPLTHSHTAVLLDEYRRFLEEKLWIRKKTTWQSPPKIEALVQEIAESYPAELHAILAEVREWKAGVAAELGAWLLGEAKQKFGSEVAVCHLKAWFSFVPREYDEIPLLRRGGGDPDAAFDGRLLIYQFFVIPFGDNVSVRPPQLALDIKMLNVRPDGMELKQHLHTAARGVPLFNRARGDRPTGNDHLLNHELLTGDDIARSSAADLRKKLHQRLDRFYNSIHPEVVAFFRTEVAAYEGHRRHRSYGPDVAGGAVRH